MQDSTRLLRSLLLATAAIGACSEMDDGSSVEDVTSALSVCDEVVPANRFVDGIPGYAQCPGFENAAIYSNNGVDTSTTSLGADWVRTQGSGGYQCTELAHRYLHFRWNVTSWLPRGNAGVWCDTQPTAASGVVQTTVPVHGDLIVFAPGVCGSDATTGHVALVDIVDAAKSQVTIVEENRAGRRSTAQSCATCYLHVIANDGVSTGGAGASGAAGASGRGGASGAAGASGGGGASGFPGATGLGGATGFGGAAGSGGVTGSAGGSPGTTGGLNTGRNIGTGGTSVGSPSGSAGSGGSGPGTGQDPGSQTGVAGSSPTAVVGGCNVAAEPVGRSHSGWVVLSALAVALVRSRSRKTNGRNGRGRFF